MQSNFLHFCSKTTASRKHQVIMPARDSGQGFRPKEMLTSHSGLSILALDGRQKLTSKPLSQATSAATTPTSVLSVVSASLYPIPEDQSHNPEVRDRVPAYGGFTPIQQEIENDGGHFTAQTSPDALSSGAQNNSPKRPWTKPEETVEIKPPRKRGRPRKIVNFDNAGSDEVGNPKRHHLVKFCYYGPRSPLSLVLSVLSASLWIVSTLSRSSDEIAAPPNPTSSRAKGYRC